MAKFRSNHHQNRGRGQSSFLGKSILLIFIALAILLILLFVIRKDYFGKLLDQSPELAYELPSSNDDSMGRYFLPSNKLGKTYHHKNYSLSYVEKYEISEWVAYELSKESLIIPNVDRTNWYNEDSIITTGSAGYYDYKGSGFTRGHLAPAGDMAFNKEAMEESFFMSNISPQLRAFNNGIWKELEETVRDWAFKNKRIYVVTGPLLPNNLHKYIGKNKVIVPKEYYKIILDINDPEHKGIAFIIPNEKSEKPLKDYALSIDDVEELTGINFFYELMSERKEKKIEAEFDIDKWPMSEKRFELRVSRWNNQK